MAKSKYQAKLNKKLKENQGSKKKGPIYYDEVVHTKNQGSSSGFTIFLILSVIIGGTIVGIISYNNSANEQQNTNTSTSTLTTTTSSSTTTQKSGYGTDLTLQTIDGQVIRLSDHEGQVVILYFHYLSCPACSQFDPNLKAAIDQYTSSQVFLVAITVDSGDSNSDLIAWAQNLGTSWPQVRDTTYTLSSQFGVQYTPTTVFLDKSGNVAQTFVGAKTQSEVQTVINSLL